MHQQFEGTFVAPTTLRVLVVDDDPHVRKLLSRQLALLGCEAEFSESASGFLSRLSSREAVYDLAIIDINLPGLDGREIITWMRESDLSAIRCLPIVIYHGVLGLDSDRLPERPSTLSGAEQALLPQRSQELHRRVRGARELSLRARAKPALPQHYPRERPLRPQARRQGCLHLSPQAP